MENNNQVTSKKLEDIRKLLDKYRSLREEVTNIDSQNGVKKIDASEGRGVTNSFVKRKTKPGVPSMFESDHKQAGFIQVMMLSFFTMFFEGLFLLLSYFIFS